MNSNIKQPTDKSILVTGGAGFLGSHLIDRLMKTGHSIICLDNLSTGSMTNIQHLVNHPRFQFINQDIIDPINIRVDEIYNFACPASPIQYQHDPIKTLKTSVLGALNMLENCERYGSKIIHASTSEVYGDPEIHPQAETYWGNVNPVGERSCYDEGKRCAETLFNDYRRRHNVETKLIRIFNTYGPRMHPQDGRVISNFIVQAINDQPITIYGDGLQTRSFCFVDDLIDGIVNIMNTSYEISGPINLGNPIEYTILELAKKVIDIANSKSEIIFLNLPADDPKKRKPNVDQAKTLINWQPSINLEYGIQRTIEYFKKLPMPLKYNVQK